MPLTYRDRLNENLKAILLNILTENVVESLVKAEKIAEEDDDMEKQKTCRNLCTCVTIMLSADIHCALSYAIHQFFVKIVFHLKHVHCPYNITEINDVPHIHRIA